MFVGGLAVGDRELVASILQVGFPEREKEILTSKISAIVTG